MRSVAAWSGREFLSKSHFASGQEPVSRISFCASTIVACPEERSVEHRHGIVAATIGLGFEHQVSQLTGLSTAMVRVHLTLFAQFH